MVTEKKPSQRREDVIRVRVTAAQKKKIVHAAKASNLDMSSWVRMIVLREAEKGPQ